MSITVPGPFIVGFNGPPGSGKDFIATHLIEALDKITDMPIQRHALAGTMREGGFAILGLTGGDRFYANIKDKPLPVLKGGTFRRFMIDMSEQFVKKIYGGDFWARLLHSRNEGWWTVVPTILVVTDIGFADEVGYLCENSFQMLNVRLDRPGADFSNDSRGFCSAQSYANGHDFALTNDETPEVAVEAILRQISRLGWPIL